MNILDLIIIVLVIISVVSAYFQGLIKSVFNLVSWVVSILLANYLYPPVSKLMRSTSFYTSIKESITGSLGLDKVVAEATAKAQADLINSMYVPDFIRKSLLENNNPEIYKILNVSGIQDYISGYVANILINIISIILVFCLVFIIMRLLGSALDIISRLPVINTFNRLGGALIGLFNATIIIWIMLTAFTFFIHGETYTEIITMIDNSLLAKWFYETNIILKFILRVAA